jgi:hypothetical protein
MRPLRLAPASYPFGDDIAEDLGATKARKIHANEVTA